MVTVKRVPVNPNFEDILPCPCCSSEKANKKNNSFGMFNPVVECDGGFWIVRCPCGLQMGKYVTREAAISQWNRRGGVFLNNDGEKRYQVEENEETKDD